MKKLFTLIAFAVLAVTQAFAAEELVWEKDFTTVSSFPYYVMGYTPTFDGGYMHSENPGGWYQYFIADGIPCKEKGAGDYKVVVKIKSNKSANLNLNMGWGWGTGQSASGQLSVINGWKESVVNYYDIPANDCNLVLQPGGYDGTIDIEWIKVYKMTTDGPNHALKVSTTEGKTNAWDSQVHITLPTALESGKKYTLNMKVKGAQQTIGLQPVFIAPDPEDAEKTKANYLTSFNLLTDWTKAAGQTNGSYAYNKISFNFGKLDGDLYIDDLTITDADENVVYTNDFESDLSDVTTPHSHVALTIEEIAEKIPGTLYETEAVTMPAAGYRTYAVGSPGITMPAGLKAYGAKVNASKTSVVLTEMTTVPSYNVAVLQGEPGDYVCLKNAAWANTSSISDLKFDWGEKTITGTDNIYVLAQQGSSVVFAPASAGKLPACKGYLVIEGVSGAAKSLNITFDEEATGISNVNTTAKSSVAYNLAGQRVNANTKGIVIIDGKKYFNK